MNAQTQTAAPKTQDTKAVTSPKKKHLPHKTSSSLQYFNVFGNHVKYVMFHMDTVRFDTGKPFATCTAEYVWDTINYGYIFVIKEQRLFCNGVNPDVLQGDIKNILSIIPKNGFRLLDKTGGEFYVNVEEALYDGGEDSVFIAVDINGFVGGDAEFEEHGVVGMRYKDMQLYNDSLYKRPDHYPMNRFNRPLELR